MADTEVIESLISYYVDLLIVQYHNKTNARATIDAVIREGIANGLVFDVRDAFSVDTASGVQLDIIGQYVGVNRFYQSQDLVGTWFGYSDAFSYEPPDVTGYSRPADFLTKTGEFLSASDIIGTGYSLSDTDFRLLIKLKILLNNSNFSNGSIDSDIYQIFGESLYAVDNLNMSMEYFTSSELSLIVKVALAKELLPHPMGVRINNVIDDLVYFGYSDALSTQPIDGTGYASAGDFSTKSGTFLGITNIIA